MKDDRAHAQALLRDLALINARTVRELGPLQPGGLPVEPKRKPNLPKRATPPTHIESLNSNEESDMDWTRIAATATLTAAVSLSACAADQGAQTSVTPPPPTQAEPVAAVAEATQAQTAVDQKPTVEDQEAEPERGPPIAAAELRRRVLALIGSFESLEDLEHKNVERTMQITLIKRPTMSDGYHAFGKTSEGWNYRVAVERLDRLDQPPTVRIYLNNGVEPWTDQQPTYCTLEFESLANDMVAMGYERSEKMFRRKGDQWWGFRRKSNDTRAVMGAMVYVYALTIDGKLQYCIRSLSFGGDSSDE
jgi:hypothetical protein